jgi:hypothetical protein
LLGSLIKARFDVLLPPRLHDGQASLVLLERIREIPDEQPRPVRTSTSELAWVSILQQINQVLATRVKRLNTYVHRANLATSSIYPQEPLIYPREIRGSATPRSTPL